MWVTVSVHVAGHDMVCLHLPCMGSRIALAIDKWGPHFLIDGVYPFGKSPAGWIPKDHKYKVEVRPNAKEEANREPGGMAPHGNRGMDQLTAGSTPAAGDVAGDSDGGIS